MKALKVLHTSLAGLAVASALSVNMVSTAEAKDGGIAGQEAALELSRTLPGSGSAHDAMRTILAAALASR